MEGLNVTIRPAERKDCESIFVLIQKLAKFEKVNDIKITKADLERDGFDSQPPLFYSLLAETENSENGKIEPIGLCMYYNKYSTWDSKGLHLKVFYVMEEHQKKGVGEKLLKSLAKIGVDGNDCRISFEIVGSNIQAVQFYQKHGALNLTKDEGWLNYNFSRDAIEKFVKESELQGTSNKIENIIVRSAERTDCKGIAAFVKELASFEKMADRAKLTEKDFERDGFDSHYFSALVAEVTDPKSGEKEIAGFALYFYTYTAYEGKKIHLEDLYVTPKYRLKGVGVKLFVALAKMSYDKGYFGFTLECLDWNTPAQKFYEKFHGLNLTKTSQILSFRYRRDAMKALAQS